MNKNVKISKITGSISLPLLALTVASIAWLTRELTFTYNGVPVIFSLGVFLIFSLFLLAIRSEFLPEIDVFLVEDNHNKIKLTEREPLDVKGENKEFDLRFEVPDQYDEIFLHFDIEEYKTQIIQPQPVNYDLNEAITYYSHISEFELTLKLRKKSGSTNQGSELPLNINDKINDESVCEVMVSG